MALSAQSYTAPFRVTQHTFKNSCTQLTATDALNKSRKS